MAAAQFIVRGVVQGVFYRAGTREQAVSLGLRGQAKNLRDGSVEVLAAGDADALAALEQWLRHGPPAAEVASVERHELDDDGIASLPQHGFSIA